MNLIRKGLITLVILGFINEGFAQESSEPLRFSVLDAQNYALQNNRTLQSSKIDIEIAKKMVWETTAIGLPQLTFAANYTHQFTVANFPMGGGLDPNALDAMPANTPLTNTNLLNSFAPPQMVPMGDANSTTFDLTLSQLIFSGEYIVGLQAARVFKEISEKSFVKTEIKTKESVANSYYIVLVLGENLKVLKDSYKAIDQTHNEMVKMYEQGFNEQTDVDQLKISKSNIQTVITSLEAQKEVSMKLLKLQLGVDFNQTVILTDSLSGIINQNALTYLVSKDFNPEGSVDYQIMSTQEKLMALSLKRAKSKFLPTVSAFYRHQQLLNEPLINFQPKDMLGVSINFPIFTSGQRLSQVSQAKLNLEKTRLSKDDVGQGLVLEFEQAHSDYQTAFSNFTVNNESMELSKRVYDRTIIKYREGVSSSFELAQNQNQFLTAESNYFNSVLSLLGAKAKLDRILNKYEGLK
ncbi:MAG: TolC family protein [Bacteroidales bacterium]|nr:MAG: TolC family protein [Bacteroidales bacterium]